MWKILFVNTAAEKEIAELTPDLKAKFIRTADLLIKYGPLNVGMPHVRFLRDKLWELRIKGKDNIARSIYTLITRQQILVLHTFIKKTEKAPKSALEMAINRLKEHNNEKL